MIQRPEHIQLQNLLVLCEQNFDLCKILIKKPVNLPNMRLRLLRRHRKTADLAAARNIILKLLFHVKSPFLMCGWYAFIIQ